VLEFFAMNADKAFLIILIGIAIAAFLVSRVGELPAKGWVFVAAAATSVIGWQVLRSKRKQILQKQIVELEGRIKEREELLKEQQKVYEHADAALVQEQAALEAQKLEVQRQTLLIEAESRARERAIMEMTPAEVRAAAARDL
jgi:hypothetical protein